MSLKSSKQTKDIKQDKYFQKHLHRWFKAIYSVSDYVMQISQEKIIDVKDKMTWI